MKKFFSVFFSILLAFSAFAGCNDVKDDVVIEIWHYYNNNQLTAFNKMVQEFNETVGAKNKITVKAKSHVGVPQLSDAVLASADKKPGAEPMPQMFQAYSDNAYQIFKKNMLADLSKYFTKAELDKYVDGYIEEGRLAENQLNIFPIAKATEVFMINNTDWLKFTNEYNKTHKEKVTEADFSTIEKITAVSEKYFNATGKAFFARDALANYLISGAMQLGTEIFKVKDGKVTYDLNTATFRKLWDNYYAPYIKGYFNLNDKFASGGVMDGNILSFIGSTTSCTYFPTKVSISESVSYDIQPLVLPAPVFENGKKVYIQQGAGMCVTKSDEQKEAACALFLKWFTETERNIEFALSSGYLPVIKEAQNMEKINAFINKTDFKIKQVSLDTMKVAFDMINTGTMYANKSFNGGNEARKTLENLKNKANADYKKVLDGETTVANLLTDSAFNTWLATLSASLNAIE